MWIMLPLDEDWDSYVRFESQAGHPVVAELRVLPRVDTRGVLSHHDEHGNRWIDVTLGATPDVPIPEGGLTSRALRGVHLGRALELAYSHLDEWFKREQRYSPEHRLPIAFTEDAAGVPRRPGRKGRDDSFYVAVAAAYVDALGEGSRKPVVDAALKLSEAWGGVYEPDYVRDLLHGARQRGLLTRPPKGRAGGELTGKAIACALKALKEEALTDARDPKR
jgi:hypothetical protein